MLGWDCAKISMFSTLIERASRNVSSCQCRSTNASRKARSCERSLWFIGAVVSPSDVNGRLWRR